MAHARRKFEKRWMANKDSVASDMLNQIRKLYKIEEEIRDQKVLYGKYYELFPSFKDGIITCVDKIHYSKEYKEELSSILTFNFQFFKFT